MPSSSRGASTPTLGGGSVDAPLRFVFGDHATASVNGKPVPVGSIAEGACKRWLRENLPLVDPDRHIVFQNELRGGSVQLTDIFARETIGSNDTCIGSGYAPLTETELIVLETERFLNSADFKARFPETGQDIKVTGCRRGGHLVLTLSLAFVSARIPTERAYFERKEAIEKEVVAFAGKRTAAIGTVDVAINTLDRPGRGIAGMYVTVLGTSADSGDGGQVGRGNRPSGLNSFHRPIATGAVAGKNPAANVGKIYNLFAHEVARLIHAEVSGLEEVYVTFCSQIGEPIDRPLVAAVRVVPAAAGALGDGDAAARIREIVARELAQITAFAGRLAHEGRTVC